MRASSGRPSGVSGQQPSFAPDRTLYDEARGALADLVALEQEAVEAAAAIAEAGDAAERKRLSDRYDHLQHELHRQDAYNIDYRIRRVLDGLRFPRESLDRPVASLSGGEQNRLMLAKLLLAEPNVHAPRRALEPPRYRGHPMAGRVPAGELRRR